MATAYAGQRLGAPTTVVVPETTPEFIRDRLRSLGATVVVHGSQWSEAHAHAVALNDDVRGKLVTPTTTRHLDRHATAARDQGRPGSRGCATPGRNRHLRRRRRASRASSRASTRSDGRVGAR